MFGGASERVPTVRVPSLIRPSLDLSILSRGVTSLVVYLARDFWSLPWRASVDDAVDWAEPPPQAARETATAMATGTVVSHFKALLFITQSLSSEIQWVAGGSSGPRPLAWAPGGADTPRKIIVSSDADAHSIRTNQSWRVQSANYLQVHA